MLRRIKSVITWARDRISHKIDHFRPRNIVKIFKDNGLALVVIIIGWEIVEDVLFPLLFMGLGKYVHPGFYAGIPVAWMLCLHWIAVPILWGWWMKISDKHDGDHSGCC